MSTFEKIKSFLFESNGLKKATLDTSFNSFILLDANKVANELGVERHGLENGRANIPNSSDTKPDHFEELIASHLKALESDQINLYTKRLQALRNALGNLAADLDFQGLQAKVSHLFGQASLEVEQGVARIYLLRQKYLSAFHQYEDFKSQNNLHRIAPKNQGNTILKIGVILLLLVVETALNAGLFAQGSEGGLLGGGAVALGVSAINLAGSFLIGYKLVPYKNRNDLISKTFGYFSFISWLLLIVTLNLVAGHFREAMIVANGENVGNLVTQLFVNNPFGLKDIQSWYLLLVGLIFSTIAFADGYSFDDPFPDFGRIYRQYELEAQLLADAITDELDYLQDHFEELDSEFQSRLNSISSRRSSLSRFDSQLNALSSQLNSSQEQLALVFTAVISQYRRENERARTNPPPTYFKEKIYFSRSAIFDQGIDKKLSLEVAEKIEKGATELPKLIKSIRLKHEELRALIPNFESLSNA